MTSVCVRMSLLCVLHVNRCRTHLVACLVKFVHVPHTFLVSKPDHYLYFDVYIFIIYSGVNSGHGIGDFCVCEDEHYF